MTPPRDRAATASSEVPALHLVPDPDEDIDLTDREVEVDDVPEDADAPAAEATAAHGAADHSTADHSTPDDSTPDDSTADDKAGSDKAGDRAGAGDGIDERSPIEQARAALEALEPAHAYRMVAGLARPTHDSVLQALPYTPALSYHHPDCVVVEPEPVGVETVELYARTAYPDWDRVLVDAFADPVNAGTLTAIHHLIVGEGANVALVTNHGQIIDIALVLAALESAMMASGREFGVLGERIEQEDLALRMNVLVSRMVTTRQAFGIPAIQVLQSAARTYLSIPQTASRRRARIDPAIVRANNVVMRDELDQRLAGGGQLLAMAASGSQDLTLPNLVHKARTMWRQRRGDDPGEAPTLHLQPLYDGTVSLMQSCRYVLPIAICLDPVTPACSIGGLTRVHETDDCHRMMDWIALAHQEATGVPTIYHWHEDDLLTQVRAYLNR